MKPKHESYNDGFLEYGSTESLFNANRKKIGEEFTTTGNLFYKEMSARDSDILQASNMGYVIDLKIKTPYMPEVNSKNKVKISEEIFDIQKLDYNREKREMFLYLQKVGV